MEVLSMSKKKNTAVYTDENGVERITGIEKKYNDQTHRLGLTWDITAFFVFMLIPVAISLHLHAWPTAKAFLSAATLFLITALGGVGEDILYTSMIGPSATYVSFLTGNISNLKFPCTASALESSGYDVHSDEGEVIATIAVCVSSIVTVLVIAIFCVLLAPFLPKLQSPGSFFYPALRQVLPCLFGAIIVPYCVKNPKLWEFPVVVLALVYWFVPNLGISVMTFIGVIVAMIGAYAEYKFGWLDGQKHPRTKKVKVNPDSVSKDIQGDISDSESPKK